MYSTLIEMTCRQDRCARRTSPAGASDGLDIASNAPATVPEMGWRHIAQTSLANLCRVLFLHHDLNALAGLKYERDQRVDREFRRIPI